MWPDAWHGGAKAATSRNYLVCRVRRWLDTADDCGPGCFYARPSDDVYALDPAFDEAIRAAEWESTETCEDCGAPGAGCYTIRLWSWTLCPEHARERLAVAQS